MTVLLAHSKHSSSKMWESRSSREVVCHLHIHKEKISSFTSGFGRHIA